MIEVKHSKFGTTPNTWTDGWLRHSPEPSSRPCSPASPYCMDDSECKSVLEALAPGEGGAVGDGKPWKGEVGGDLPLREGWNSSPISRSPRSSSSNMEIFYLKHQFFLEALKMAKWQIAKWQTAKLLAVQEAKSSLKLGKKYFSRQNLALP